METPTELLELIVSKSGYLAGFSDLPEPIIDHVFSLIGSNDIFPLSYVCRKFRNLSLCSPSLLFTLGFDSDKCTYDCKQLQRFLKGFLNQHNAPRIHRLRLHWFCRSCRYDAKGSSFSMWVQKALMNKVQELDIGVHVKTGKAFCLPPGIESLRVLKLKLQGGTVPKLFASVFDSLDTLSLSSVTVPGLEFGEWISYSCRSLKVLNLENVDGLEKLYISNPTLRVMKIFGFSAIKSKDNLTWSIRPGWDVTPDDSIISIHCFSLDKLEISECVFDYLDLNVNAPCLKDLQISNCRIHGFFNVRISAEQLQTLTLTMELSLGVPETSLSRCRIYSDNLVSLCKAAINLVVPCSSTFDIADNMYREFNNNGLVELFYSVRYAKILQLNFQTIAALSNNVQLKNIWLEHLEASVVDLNDIDITELGPFLRCCRSLKTLTVRCDNNENGLSEAEMLGVGSEMEKLDAECRDTRITCNLIINPRAVRIKALLQD
ncbi:hypothetical protein GQ457_05G018060 [Hibiscus cannabinus]